MKTLADHRKQRGYVLLAMLLVFFVSGSTMMLNIMNNRHYAAQIEEDDELFRQMSMAKEALLAYAASSGNILSDDGSVGPGFLPCPDSDNDGAEDSDCSGTNVGRLPEYVTTISGGKIHLNDYFADQDEQFWYAVSPLHLYSAGNTDAGNRTLRDAGHSRLELDDSDQIVALIIAPGSPLGDQNRGEAPTERANYLEQDNGESDSEFISDYADDPDAFNDTVLAITHDELMLAIGKIAAARVQSVLDGYHDTEDEYPDTVQAGSYISEQFWSSPASDWFGTEGWAARGSQYLFFGLFPLPYYEMLHTNYAPDAINHSVVTITFGDCTGITYTLEYRKAIKREGMTCE